VGGLSLRQTSGTLEHGPGVPEGHRPGRVEVVRVCGLPAWYTLGARSQWRSCRHEGVAGGDRACVDCWLGRPYGLGPVESKGWEFGVSGPGGAEKQGQRIRDPMAYRAAPPPSRAWCAALSILLVFVAWRSLP
jgi:hypothetical protein